MPHSPQNAKGPPVPGQPNHFRACPPTTKSGTKQVQAISTSPSPQVDWTAARDMERCSILSAREALIMRGAERFQALALASTYAVAARDLALSGRGAR